MKNILRVLCMTLIFVLLCSCACASVWFDENGSAWVDQRELRLPVLGAQVMDALEMESAEINWVISDLETGASASASLPATETNRSMVFPEHATAIIGRIQGGLNVVGVTGDGCEYEIVAVSGLPMTVLQVLELPCGLTMTVYDVNVNVMPIIEEDEEATICETGRHHLVWVNEVYPTCVTPGIRYLKCDVCGIETTEKRAALGHNKEVIPAVAPTCKTPGSTAGEKCSRCGTILVKPKAIPPLQHQNELVEQETAATCTEAGKTAVYKCTVCGTVSGGKKIPATGHKQVVDEQGKDPTCTEDGWTTSTKCEVCGTVIKRSESRPALGHQFKDGVCTRCGEPAPQD